MLLLTALPAGAQVEDGDKAAERLRAVEGAAEERRAEAGRLSEKAQAAARELEELRAEGRRLAAQAQEHEARLDALEARLAELAAAIKKRSAELHQRREQSVALVAALQRLALTPRIALLARPGEPAEGVRGGILLQSALPRVEEAAARLRDELRTLAAMRAEMADKRVALEREERQLAEKRDRLAALAQRQSKLHATLLTRASEAERNAERLAREAQSLRELVARLREEAERRRRLEAQAEKVAALRKPRPFTKGRDDRLYPANGRLVGRFGEDTGLGSTRKGISLETRPGAQVVAPYDGTVAFAGPFRGYGRLLIIEHSEGYHSLLAGMGRIDSSLGQHVTAGEPVGVMPSTDAKPTLYIELRHRGEPINPVPWLTARNSKVSG